MSKEEIVRVISKEQAILEEGLRRSKIQVQEYEKGIIMEKCLQDGLNRELKRIIRNGKGKNAK